MAKERMTNLISTLLLLLHLNSFLLVAVSDPDPLQDFCIPAVGGPLQCKDPSNVTADDFVFSTLKVPLRFSPATGLSAFPVDAALFPALNTLSASFVRADLEPGGVNPPHYHPRATEVALVLAGRVYSGFVDPTGRTFAKVVEVGDVVVFPRGAIHFQRNVGDSVASLFGWFNSQRPGLTRISTAVFGSQLDDELLQRSFGLSRREIARMRKQLAPHP